MSLKPSPKLESLSMHHFLFVNLRVRCDTRSSRRVPVLQLNITNHVHPRLSRRHQRHIYHRSYTMHSFVTMHVRHTIHIRVRRGTHRREFWLLSSHQEICSSRFVWMERRTATVMNVIQDFGSCQDRRRTLHDLDSDDVICSGFRLLSSACL